MMLAQNETADLAQDRYSSSFPIQLSDQFLSALGDNNFYRALFDETYVTELLDLVWSYSNQVFVIIRNTAKLPINDSVTIRQLLESSTSHTAKASIESALSQHRSLHRYQNFLTDLNICVEDLNYFLNFNKVVFWKDTPFLMTQDYERQISFIVNYKTRAANIRKLLLSADYPPLVSKVEKFKYEPASTLLASQFFDAQSLQATNLDPNTLLFLDWNECLNKLTPSFKERIIAFIRKNPSKLLAQAVKGTDDSKAIIVCVLPGPQKHSYFLSGLVVAKSSYMKSTSGFDSPSALDVMQEMARYDVYLSRLPPPTDIELLQNKHVARFLCLIGYAVPESLLLRLRLRDNVRALRSYLRLITAPLNFCELALAYYKSYENTTKFIDFHQVAEACRLRSNLMPFELNDYLNYCGIAYYVRAIQFTFLRQLIQTGSINRQSFHPNFNPKELQQHMRDVNLNEVVHLYFHFLRDMNTLAAQQLIKLYRNVYITKAKQLEERLNHFRHLFRVVLNETSALSFADSQNYDDHELVITFINCLLTQGPKKIMAAMLQAHMTGLHEPDFTFIKVFIACDKLKEQSHLLDLVIKAESEVPNFVRKNQPLYLAVTFFLKRTGLTQADKRQTEATNMPLFYGQLKAFSIQEVVGICLELRFFNFVTLDLVTLKKLIENFYSHTDSKKCQEFKEAYEALNHTKCIKEVIEPVINETRRLIVKYDLSQAAKINALQSSVVITEFYSLLARLEFNQLKALYKELSPSSRTGRLIFSMFKYFLQFHQPAIFDKLAKPDLASDSPLITNSGSRRNGCEQSEPTTNGMKHSV